MNKVIPDKKQLEELYIKQDKSMNEIAGVLQMSVGKVFKFIHKYQIPSKPRWQGMKGKILSDEQRKKISIRNKGKILSDETKKKISESHKKGGVCFKKVRTDGYIAIYFPDHPKSTKEGYIMEHTLVMESLLGRHLKENECVHHINENKADNRKENLKLMTKSEHMSYHSKKRWAEVKNNA